MAKKKKSKAPSPAKKSAPPAKREASKEVQIAKLKDSIVEEARLLAAGLKFTVFELNDMAEKLIALEGGYKAPTNGASKPPVKAYDGIELAEDDEGEDDSDDEF